eukprot:m.154662 g.154662  ORF g.154662 m.154662 type:complete len:733 (-) comp10195_c0_seq3:203-2401(-)
MSRASQALLAVAVVAVCLRSSAMASQASIEVTNGCLELYTLNVCEAPVIFRDNSGATTARRNLAFADSVSAVESAVATVASDLASLSATAATAAALDELDGKLAELGGKAALASDLEALRDVSATKEALTALANDVAYRADLTSLEEQVALASDLDDLRVASATKEALGELAARVDGKAAQADLTSTRADVSELQLTLAALGDSHSDLTTDHNNTAILLEETRTILTNFIAELSQAPTAGVSLYPATTSAEECSGTSNYGQLRFNTEEKQLQLCSGRAWEVVAIATPGSSIAFPLEACTEAPDNESGVYYVRTETETIRIYCDMLIAGGGWAYAGTISDVEAWKFAGTGWASTNEEDDFGAPVAPFETPQASRLASWRLSSFKELLVTNSDGSSWIVLHNFNGGTTGFESLAAMFQNSFVSAERKTSQGSGMWQNPFWGFNNLLRNPPRKSCIDHYNAGARVSGTYRITAGHNFDFPVYCDMVTDGLVWTLVAITNGQNGGAAPYPSINYQADPSNPTVGEYVKRLDGLSGTHQRYECGRGSNNAGSLVASGGWTWPMGQYLTTNPQSIVRHNVVWIPKLPGISGNSDAPWNNHISGVHYPNFGVNGFFHVDGRRWDTRYAFTCNPQSGAFGTGDTTFIAGSGSPYVRYWLATAPATQADTCEGRINVCKQSDGPAQTGDGVLLGAHCQLPDTDKALYKDIPGSRSNTRGCGTNAQTQAVDASSSFHVFTRP